MTVSFRPVAEGVDVVVGERTVRLSFRWLRDNGDDPASRDQITGQRLVDTFTIDPAVTGSVAETDSALVVDWADGSVTTHDRRRLIEVATEYFGTDWSGLPKVRPRRPDNITTWGRAADVVPSPNAVDLSLTEVLSDDAALVRGLDTLARLGFLVLRGGPAERTTAEVFARRVGYPRRTVFGSVWDLAPDLADHADSAYGQSDLEPHTDGTYSRDAPGLQFFLCLTPAPSGGESTLVDGFAIADHLGETEPDIHCDLASIPVAGEYIEPGIHLRAERPVLGVDSRGVLNQVSFNNADRAPTLLPKDLEERFDRAYARFARLVAEPDRRLQVALNPGDLLLFDNWRILHGRRRFDGHRHYVGAYLNHEDLESRRRTLAASPESMGEIGGGRC